VFPKARALASFLVAGLLGISLSGTVSATSLSWKAVTTPNPGVSPRDGPSREGLLGVAATSATNAWAVGDYYKRHRVPDPRGSRFSRLRIATPHRRQAMGR
jgi:hypothetical protein